MKKSTKKHLFKLNLMSKLAQTTLEENIEKFNLIIAETFEVNTNAEIEKIVKFVATARGENYFVTQTVCIKSHFQGFQLYFDFDKETIGDMSNNNVFPSFFHQNPNPVTIIPPFPNVSLNAISPVTHCRRNPNEEKTASLTAFLAFNHHTAATSHPPKIAV
jgi:hypothetical protein